MAGVTKLSTATIPIRATAIWCDPGNLSSGDGMGMRYRFYMPVGRLHFPSIEHGYHHDRSGART